MKIDKRSFDAAPSELVPSRGVNEIMDNQLGISDELWTMLQFVMDGSAEFASMLFSDPFNVPKAQQSSSIDFTYGANGMITQINMSDGRTVVLEVDEDGGITGTPGGIKSVLLTAPKNNQTLKKRISFTYENGNISRVSIATI